MYAHVKECLERRSPGYHVIEERPGTYGVVFVLQSDRPQTPEKFCLKTLSLQRMESQTDDKDTRALFEREINLWLSIPYHLNVLSGLGLEFAPAPKVFQNQLAELPLVRMKFCPQNLADWIENRDAIPNETDRLFAIAQVCNGLRWLYNHGIEGHGDVKPDNLLVDDLSESFPLEEQGFPNTRHPWLVRVADLGWADIWRDLGGTQHSWRPYLAPERFEKEFVPEASDVYAVGVIGAELLQDYHPAGDYTRVLASNNKWNRNNGDRWRKWASQGKRELGEVQDISVRDLLEKCLTPDPDKRPSCDEIISQLDSVLRENHGVNAQALLEAWNEDARGQVGGMVQSSWAAEQSAKLGDHERDRAIQTLESLWNGSLSRESNQEIAEWLAYGRSLAHLLVERQVEGDGEHAAQVCEQLLDYILEHFTVLDLRDFVYGPAADGMEPRDSLIEFASPALDVFAQVRGSGDHQTTRYWERLNRAYGIG